MKSYEDILEEAINIINKKIILGDENPFYYANLAIAYVFTEECNYHIQYSIDIVNDIFKTGYLKTDAEKVIDFLEKQLMNHKNWNFYYADESKISFSFLVHDDVDNLFDEVMNIIDLNVYIDSNKNIIDYKIIY